MSESLLEMILYSSVRIYGTGVDLHGWIKTTEEEFKFLVHTHPPEEDDLSPIRSAYYEIPTFNIQKILVTHGTYSFCRNSIFVKSLVL